MDEQWLFRHNFLADATVRTRNEVSALDTGRRAPFDTFSSRMGFALGDRWSSASDGATCRSALDLEHRRIVVRTRKRASIGDWNWNAAYRCRTSSSSTSTGVTDGYRSSGTIRAAQLLVSGMYAVLGRISVPDGRRCAASAPAV